MYSRGLNEEETRLARGLAKELGTKNLVCGYLEPDNCFNYRLDGTQDAKLDEVRSAAATLLVGDVFMTSPVAAGPLTEARYADRKNRLVVIDSLRTKQAGFAHQFIQVKPGTEGFALLALAGILGKTAGVDPDRYCQLSGVDRQSLEQAAKTLQAGATKFVGCAMHMGRVGFPVLVSLAAQLVALKLKAGFTGFGEGLVPPGMMKFGELRKAAGEGRIKLLLWFGSMYPYSYPEVFPELAKVEHRMVTSIFKPEQSLPGLVLPVPSELEKESSGSGYWGKVERHPLAAPCSGSRPAAWIMEQLAEPSAVAEEPQKPMSAAEVAKLGARYADGKQEDAGLVLLGEKRASGIGGFYTDEEELGMNPADAARLELTDQSAVEVETVQSKVRCRVHLTQSTPVGAVSIGVNVHRNRALFPILTDPVLGETVIPPVAVKVAKTSEAELLPIEAVKEG